MAKIHILDCTLRDGGYCNQWKFGYKNKEKIITNLEIAGIDLIECGYLSNRVSYDKDSTQFRALKDVNQLFKKKNNNNYILMVNYGEYDIDEIPAYSGSGVAGIRVAFHKKDMIEALAYCRTLKMKNYKVFVQPMVSMAYSDMEFIEMINYVNQIKPYAFYIVDSFGMMKKKSLLRLFYMVEHNLENEICIGFHSHNNLQLAYSNAQSLIETQTQRELIIDASVYGMGRGAGNLNTELFAEYLNEYADGSYQIKPLLQIIDESLNDFYKINSWGYSLARYLSAKYEVHPNYASFLEDKNTLTLEAMDEILSSISQENKYCFNKEYIEMLYVSYMEESINEQKNIDDIKSIIANKKVLLIAPGKNAEKYTASIKTFLKQKDAIGISINFKSEYAEYLFVSNLIRYRNLESKWNSKCIVTTNIHAKDVLCQIEYEKLIADEKTVYDNAGLMAIKLMILLGKNEVYLAGFDGYSHNPEDNYVADFKRMIMKNSIIDAMNLGMKKMLRTYGKQIAIKYITNSIYNEE